MIRLGLGRAPFSATFPPAMASAASARVLKKRAAQSHLSILTSISWVCLSFTTQGLMAKRSWATYCSQARDNLLNPPVAESPTHIRHELPRNRYRLLCQSQGHRRLSNSICPHEDRHVRQYSHCNDAFPSGLSANL